MRELKFRAWKEVNGKMHRWICPPIPRASDFIEISQDMDIRNFIKGADVIEQYTGLKDKNDKEIYEGDIVEYMTCYYGNKKRHRKVVEWEEWDSDDFGEPHNLGYFNLSECMEVIGNMHENPELLSKEEG